MSLKKKVELRIVQTSQSATNVLNNRYQVVSMVNTVEWHIGQTLTQSDVQTILNNRFQQVRVVVVGQR